MAVSKAGRKPKVNPVAVAGWRQTRSASIAETAKHFGISASAVKSYCRTHGEEARQARERWRLERELSELDQIEYAAKLLEINLQRVREAEEEAERSGSWMSFIDVIDAANRLGPKEYRNKKPG